VRRRSFYFNELITKNRYGQAIYILYGSF
jgi:hypothetical protein